MNIKFFPYSWHVKDNEVHVYGFEKDNKVSLLRLEEFTPYVYIKLPKFIDWNSTNTSRLVSQLKKHGSIFKTSLMYKKPLYYANVYTEENKLKCELCPYLFVAFNSEKDRKNFVFSVRKKINVTGIGNINLEIYENNASAVLQLTCLRKISTADWFQVKNCKLATEPVSRLPREYLVSWKCCSPIVEEQLIPKPLIMSYDIECKFNDPNKFSDGSHPNDTIFQISCVFGVQGSSKSTWENYLLTLGNPDETLLKNIKVLKFQKEFQLLMAFSNLVIQKNPQLLLGYNIFKFDIPFMYKRAIEQHIHDDFVRYGCTRDKCKLESIKWSSSAFSNQEMNFLDLQGRMTIDLLTLIQRDFNLDSYKLDSVAEKFIGSKKDPLNHLDIFMCYELGIKESTKGISKSLALVGKYCVKDSILVLELFEKMQYWYSLTEMAKICQVPHSHLFLYGQQLKVFSQVYKYCYNNNIVVESGNFKTSEEDFCAGASVLTPEPGLYENVVSFDFASLYPSIIISHNIDFTTLVRFEDEEKLPKDTFQTIEWEEHINCLCEQSTKTKDTKDIRCKKYHFSWLKNTSVKGVLPIIIKNLLDARKQVRQQMKEIDKSSLYYDILNKRQLAYKVSSNSMYGALSTKKGYLPFLPAGMCITAIGRKSIEKVSNIIQSKYQGKVVYGDTDSNYVIFPGLTKLEDIWSHSVKVSDEVSKYFPEPMRLEFEENIYARYLILSKKRYLYHTCTPDGTVSTKIENKGVLLKRRDNSKVIRDIYELIIRLVLANKSENEVVCTFVRQVERMFSMIFEIDDFKISKSVKSIENFVISNRDIKTIQYGDYVVPRLHSDPEKRIIQIKDKGCNTEEEFYNSHLPGAVQLALRMRSRGQHVDSGSRLSFVVSKRAGVKSNVSEKIEDVDYFRLNYSKKMIDVFHYLHLLINPIEEVFIVMYGKKYKNFVKDMYKYRIKYDNVIKQFFQIVYHKTL